MRIEDVQRIYATHSARTPSGKRCAECGYGAPCEKQRLAEEVVKARREAEAHLSQLRTINPLLEEAEAEIERLRDKSRVRVEHQRGTTFGVYIDGEYVGTIDGEA